MVTSPLLLRAADAIVIAIDIQPALMRAIHDADRATANAKLLLQSAAILGVPVIATTQNAPRLGGLDDEIAAILSSSTASSLEGTGECVTPVIDKMTFSAWRSETFAAALSKLGRRQVVLCGVETHICVTQTALDLVAAGYQVHIAVDAVSSRTMEKHKLGMERLRDGGAYPIAAEAAVYEILGEAGTPQFKQILPLVK